MLNLYKYSNGSDRDPSVRVDYRTREASYENPIHLAAAAGRGFDNSPIHELYLYNDSTEINYSGVIFLTIDHDTSNGVNEHDWIQYRVLMEYTNSQGAAEAKWSPWTTTLQMDVDAVGTVTDSYGKSVTVGPKTLYYYADTTTDIRDMITFQIRYSIPVTAYGEDKTDLAVSVRADTAPNTNDGRPDS